LSAEVNRLSSEAELLRRSSGEALFLSLLQNVLDALECRRNGGEIF
jgi:hypothetical protein